MKSTKKQVTTLEDKSFSISISYPPLDNYRKEKPFLSQNRQFQWTNTNNVIYPIIPAYAATLLQKNNYQVIWDDAIAENLTFQNWFSRLIKNKPNLICIETKTPVIKYHWQIIDQIKSKLPKSIIVLMGDHVTALPKESLINSKVDYILTGGDYDFMLLSLANHLTKKTKLGSGFYYKKNNKILNSGKFALKHDHLDDLPIIDRDLTKWQLYAYNNTNYKHTPGSYIMSGRDCWWGKCTFCSWTTLFPGNSFRTFSVAHTIKEIENLIYNYGVKEIFDDSGTFPVGQWLNDFCHQLIKKNINKKIKLGCNMRFGCLNQKQYKLMSQAGFRFLLYGLESSNQNTLNKINKNSKTEFVKKDLTTAKKYGLEPHITIMIGYPWESKKDIENTLNLSKNLFKMGLVDTMQATITIPYPGTPLFNYCQKNKLLLTKNWNNYDMSQAVMKTSISDPEFKKYIQTLFKNIITPHFIINKIKSIHNFSDLRFLINYSYKYLLKLKDFK